MTLENLTLIFGACLFVIGVTGALVRRNAVVILMSIELILNGVNVTFVTFSHVYGDIGGQMMAIFVMVVAAAEAAVGLAIIIALFKRRPTVNVDEFQVLKW